MPNQPADRKIKPRMNVYSRFTGDSLPSPNLPGNEEVERSVRPAAFDLAELFRFLRLYKYFLLFIVSISALATAIYVHVAPPKFSSRAVIRVARPEAKGALDEVLAAQQEEPISRTTVLIEYFNSADIDEQILEIVRKKIPNVEALLTTTLENQAGLLPSREKISPAQIKNVRRHLNLNQGLVSSSMVIEATTSDAELTAALANAAAQVVVDYSYSLNVKKISEIKTFLSAQENDLGRKLRTLENDLSVFQTKHQTISVVDAQRSADGRKDRLVEQLTDLKVKKEANTKVIAEMRKELELVRSKLSDPSVANSDFYFKQLQNKINLTMYRLQAMKQVAKPDLIKKKVLEGELTRLSGLYKKSLNQRSPAQDVSVITPWEYARDLEKNLIDLKNEQQRLGTDLEVVKKTLETEVERFGGTSKMLRNLGGLQRELQLTTDLYMNIKKKLQEVEIEEKGIINEASLLSEAGVPTRQRRPDLSVMVLFAMVSSFVIGVFLIFARESLVHIVRDRHDLENTGVMFAVELPLSPLAAKKDRILVLDDPESYEANVFRTLRLRFLSLVKGRRAAGGPEQKVIVFTSPRSESGKTFTVANFGVTLARTQYKTLVIDLDLRNPSIYRYFADQEYPQKELRLEGLEGVPAVIINPLPFLDVILFKGVEGMNPAEVLDSQIFPNLVKKLREQYDFILIDTPPVLGVVDPIMIAAVADLIALVVVHRKTLRKDLSSAAQAFREISNVSILGIINMVRVEFTHYGLLKRYNSKYSNGFKGKNTKKPAA